MILSFKGRITKAVASGVCPKGFPADLMKTATRKLSMLDAAVTLNDLRSPPGNRLEALSGDRAGQHALRINDQWWLCFIWTEAGATEVEIVDYH